MSPVTRSEASMPSFVYVLDDGEHLKVGMTADIERRIKSLERGKAGSLRLIAIVSGGHIEERQLHRLLLPYHESGEWFRRTDESLSIVNGVIATGFVP